MKVTRTPAGSRKRPSTNTIGGSSAPPHPGAHQERASGSTSSAGLPEAPRPRRPSCASSPFRNRPCPLAGASAVPRARRRKRGQFAARACEREFLRARWVIPGFHGRSRRRRSRTARETRRRPAGAPLLLRPARAPAGRRHPQAVITSRLCAAYLFSAAPLAPTSDASRLANCLTHLTRRQES